MAVGELPRPDIRLAEDVAVLSILKALPGETLSNPLSSHVSARDSGRSLSFSRELFLSSGLASLAEISDDPNHIVAVAIQEKPETQRLAVVVAINKENPTSAEGALKKIKHGLQDIFGVLARVGHGIVPVIALKFDSNVLQATTTGFSMTSSVPSSAFAGQGSFYVCAQSE
ncbi:hypothetical protein GE09DRAFT_168678 [Coniochaeta sp. 2T2.1]|nr:hypothetical protein GE09DRAFT_168678 [Coniochaeta sp. 2T2.1]